MAKINNREIYNNIDFPSLLDFLLGTKEADGKTKSFPLQSVIQLINGVNGVNNIQYQFSDMSVPSDPEIDYLTPGYFFTNNNNTEVGTFTQLIFNKETLYPIDLTQLFNKLGELENVIIKLENPSDPNNFFNFKVVSFTDNTDYFTFGVQDFNELYLGEFINDIIYSLYFDINSSVIDDFSKVVYFNALTPETATIFDLNNPPVTNDNSLKADDDNLYIGTDASTWVYKTSIAAYETKPITSSTSNFNIAGTSTDAGNSKTANIKRTGRVGGGNAVDNDDFITKSQHDTKADILTDVNFGVFISALTSKTTPIDPDIISIVDTADSNKEKKVTLTNFKAFLKTYFDTQYTSLTFNQSRWQFSDFTGTAASQGNYVGAALASGTLSAASFTNSFDLNSLGGVVLGCATGANSGYRFLDLGAAFLPRQGITFFGRIALESSSVGRDRVIRIGIHSTQNQVSPVNGIYLEILGTSATYKATSASVSTSSSSITLSDSQTGSLAVFYTLIIEFTADRVVRCVLYDATNVSVLSKTFITSDNIPTIGTRLSTGVVSTITTAGAAALICQVDYMGAGLSKPSFLNNY